MADIRIKDLPLATGGTAPVGADAVAIDGLTTRKTTISELGGVAVPIASQAEAEAGVNAVKRMTPVTTKQSIASEVGVTLASKAQGDLANSSLQSDDIGATIQAFSANLDTLAAVVPGASGLSILSMGAVTDVRNYLDATPYVATRTALKAIDTTKETFAILTESGREGNFVWMSGDYSARISADTREGIFVKANAISSSVGAWVRVFAPRSTYAVEWFGVVTDGVTDNSAAFNGARSVISLLGGGRIEVGEGSFFMGSTVLGADGVFWEGSGWTKTRILRSGAYGHTFSQTGGAVKIKGFYFLHSSMPAEGVTSLPNRLTDGTAHIHLKDTQSAFIEDNLIWRMPYGVLNDGAYSTHVYDNWFRGYWNNDFTAAQEGIADIAFIGTSRHGQLAKLKANYFSGTYNGTKSYTFTDGSASSSRTIGWNVGSQNAIFARSIEDIEISGNYFGRPSRSCIRFALTSDPNDILIDIRIATNFFDNAGNGYDHITTESLVAGKAILGMSVIGNTFNGEYDTYSAIRTTQNQAEVKPSVYNLSVTGNNMFAFVGTPIVFAGTRGGSISGNTITSFNCFNITTFAGVNTGFKSGVRITGATSGVLTSGNTIGGGGNTIEPVTENYAYQGVYDDTAVGSGNFAKDNLLILKGSDGAARSGLSVGTKFRTITSNGPTYSNDSIVFVNPAAAMSVSLPENPVEGQEISIKDVSGLASSRNIQIIPGTGATAVDGGASVTITTNYGKMRFVCTGSSWWSI